METKDLELKKILDKYEYASIAVLHATKDGIDLLMTLGKQDIEEDIDVCEDTIYRIASISKVIVALGAMKLVEEGKLDIYEDVSKYLGFSLRNPNYPDKKITLEQIMTQSSSITDGFDDLILVLQFQRVKGMIRCIQNDGDHLQHQFQQFRFLLFLFSVKYEFDFIQNESRFFNVIILGIEGGTHCRGFLR